MHPVVVVAVHKARREFDAKAWLSARLASGGFDVVLGFDSEIESLYSSLLDSTYCYIGTSTNRAKWSQFQNATGVEWYTFEEESSSMPTNFHNVFSRSEENGQIGLDSSLDGIAGLFSWGPIEESFLREMQVMSDIQFPVFATGHPRIDLLGPPVSGFFNSEIGTIKSRYGRYILALPTKLDYPDRSVRDDLTIQRIEAETEWLQTLVRVAKQSRDLSVVVRPHYTDSKASISDRLTGSPPNNVKIEKWGNVVSWLHAADIVVSAYSTSRIEANIAGKPVIAPLHGSDSHFGRLPATAFGDVCTNNMGDFEHALVDYVRHGVLRPADQCAKSARGGDRISSYYFGSEDASAAANILNVLASRREEDCNSIKSDRLQVHPKLRVSLTARRARSYGGLTRQAMQTSTLDWRTLGDRDVWSSRRIRAWAQFASSAMFTGGEAIAVSKVGPRVWYFRGLVH